MSTSQAETKEVWREISDFPGYFVSSHGSIKSTYKPKKFKPNTIGKGYLQVSLRKGGQHGKLVSRLVAQMFVKNDDCKNKNEVNHKDLNKKNNHFSNLEWCCRKQNIEHARLAGKLVRPTCQGAKNVRARFKNKDIYDMRSYPKRWGVLSFLARKYKTTPSVVSGIRTRQTWKHI